MSSLQRDIRRYYWAAASLAGACNALSSIFDFHGLPDMLAKVRKCDTVDMVGSSKGGLVRVTWSSMCLGVVPKLST